MFPPSEYLDLSHTHHAVLFRKDEPVWTALTRIESYLEFRLQATHQKPQPPQWAFIGEHVFIGEGTVIEPGAVIKGPAWIGRNCQIRTGCYIRENVIIGDGVVCGNSSEFKNCVVFDSCEVPHYNYVGDSILGYKAHLGAGAILSNVRLDRGEVIVRDGGVTHGTGLRKFGAVVGDFAEIGCNSVINPGSLIGRKSILYPLTNFGGVLAARSILKTRQQHSVVARE
jgi:NDP-sugar pyrophosphorylase family protein